MNVALWGAQGLLAAFFLMAGLTKLTRPKEKLLQRPEMGWVDSFSAGGVKLIATAEVLGAIGLILPWALGIAKILTPLAAVGLAIIMIGAIVVHVRRHEQAFLQMVAL